VDRTPDRAADRTADRTAGHDSAALDEIELAGELMIAATDSPADRLPTARIDEVLLSQGPAEPGDPVGAPPGRRAGGEPVSSAAAE
jgi:hypothetical protein